MKLAGRVNKITGKLDGLSLDLVSTNKGKLRTIFPEYFSEG